MIKIVTFYERLELLDFVMHVIDSYPKYYVKRENDKFFS